MACLADIAPNVVWGWAVCSERVRHLCVVYGHGAWVPCRGGGWPLLKLGWARLSPGKPDTGVGAGCACLQAMTHGRDPIKARTGKRTTGGRKASAGIRPPDPERSVLWRDGLAVGGRRSRALRTAGWVGRRRVWGRVARQGADPLPLVGWPSCGCACAS